MNAAAVTLSVGTGLTLYCLVTNPSFVADFSAKGVTTIALTTISTFIGAYQGGAAGAQWGERVAKQNPGTGAFEIPLMGFGGAVVGGAAGFGIGCVVSAIALSAF